MHWREASRTLAKFDVSGGVAGRAYSFSIAGIFPIINRNWRTVCAWEADGHSWTERLILHPFDEKDVDQMSELMANPDFMRFSLGPKTHEQTAAFLETVIGWHRAGLPSPFAVLIRSEDVLVGYCGFLHQEVDDEKEIEIGYRLHPDYWNRGMTTEAAQAVRDHSFRDLKLERVISLIHPDNAPSRRIAEKIGMTLEKETLFRGFPTLVFALIRGADPRRAR